MENQASLVSIQKSIWAGRIPLEIVLAPSESRTYDQTDPYLVFSSALLTEVHPINLARYPILEFRISPRCCQSFELSFQHH